MAEVDSEDSLAVMIVWHLGLKHERRDIITRSVIKKTLFIPRDKKGQFYHAGSRKPRFQAVSCVEKTEFLSRRYRIIII